MKYLLSALLFVACDEACEINSLKCENNNIMICLSNGTWEVGSSCSDYQEWSQELQTMTNAELICCEKGGETTCETTCEINNQNRR